VTCGVRHNGMDECRATNGERRGLTADPRII